jgi:hypothetical protein
MKAQIEFTFSGDLDREFAQEYLENITKMMYMFHFVDAVTKAEVTQDTKEFVVDYNDCYVKSVFARDEEEARRLVIDEKQGDTLYFTQSVSQVEEKR